MVTITHTNTAKLKEKIFKQEIEKIKSFYPNKGKLSWQETRDVRKLIDNHIKAKVLNYYHSQERDINKLKIPYLNVVDEIRVAKTDSKAEKVLYLKLKSQEIPFDFQYPVGPYWADFLIKGILDLELDGPAHDKAGQRNHDVKRDKYFIKMGYKVLRVPIWLVALDEDAVFEEILEITG